MGMKNNQNVMMSSKFNLNMFLVLKEISLILQGWVGDLVLLIQTSVQA